MMNRVLALILALIMLFTLTACDTEVDRIPMSGANDVVLRVFDTEVTKYQLYTQLSTFVGKYDMTMADVLEEKALREKLVGDFISDMVVDYVWLNSYEDYGYKFNQAEQDEFEKQFEEFLVSLDEVNKENYIAEGGKADRFVEERLSLRERYFKMLGYSEEEFKDYQKAVFISGKVEDLILAEAVNIPPETVEGYYNNLLKDGKNQMARTYTFTSADPVITVYCDQGYRYVKHLQLSFPAASILNNAKLYTEGNTADLQKSIDRDVAYIQNTIDEIRAKIKAGVDFDTLIEQYGDDEAMKLEPYKSRGYIVVDGDTSVIESYRTACESLTDTTMVGECATYEAFFFVQASEISGPAPMPFEEIKAEMTAELNAMEKNIQYSNITTELVNKLTESGDVMMDMDLFFKGLV
ncbi:MAG: hypothetical protein IKU72_01060 [Oscillospiraceae bacterium]|nr:hypothetical protein [Oscillospiraceae bacterium]